MTVLLISLLSRCFMLTFRMFFSCYYNVVTIMSASRLPLFLAIIHKPVVLTLNAAVLSRHSFLYDQNRYSSARCVLLRTCTFSIFSLIKFALIKNFPEFESIQTIKLISTKTKFAVLFLIIHNYFSFFSGAFK